MADLAQLAMQAAGANPDLLMHQAGIGPYGNSLVQATAANASFYSDGIHPSDGIPIYFSTLFARVINGLLR